MSLAAGFGSVKVKVRFAAFLGALLLRRISHGEFDLSPSARVSMASS